MPEFWFPAGLQGLRFQDTVDTLKRVILRTNLPPFSHPAVVQDTTSAAGPVQSAMPTPTCHLGSQRLTSKSKALHLEMDTT